MRRHRINAKLDTEYFGKRMIEDRKMILQATMNKKDATVIRKERRNPLSPDIVGKR